jgi:cation diffusion facilitator family transporter
MSATFDVDVATAEAVGKRISLISMGASGSLALVKLVVGLLAGSAAVVADGIESAGDVVASGLIWVGLWLASKPADENHPYGHGRVETLTGLGVGVGLAVVGMAIIARSLVGLDETHAPPARYAVWPLIASVFTKSGMSVWKFRVGRRIGSSALIADAWNDAVDILSGTVALVAVGLTLADPGRFLAADHWGGAAVGSIVVFLGFNVVRETSLSLIDTMPDEETMRTIRRSALKVPGALAVEKCFARKTGLRFHVDLHLEVAPEMTVRDSHCIAEEVRNKVKADLGWVADVLVHVEPHGGCECPPDGNPRCGNPSERRLGHGKH